MRLLIVFNSIDKNKDDENKYDKVVYSNTKDLSSKKRNDLKLLWSSSLQNFISKKHSAKPLINFFNYDKFSNHWFYIRFMLFYRYIENFHQIKVIEEYESNFEFIHVKNSILNANLFKNSNKITFIPLLKKTVTKNYIKKFYSLIIASIIFFFRIFNSKKLLFAKKNSIHFLQGKNKIINNVLLPTIGTKKIDNVWGVLKEKYSNEFQVIEDLDLLKELRDSNIKFKSKYFTKFNKNTYYTEYIFFRYILSFSFLFKSYKDSKNYNNLLQIINIKAIKPEELLIKNIITSKKSQFLINSMKYNAYTSFFSKFEESTITLYTENDASGKLFIDAAKKNNLATYALQHGIINESNYSYSFSKLEQSFNYLPDKTFVWGPSYLNLLVENSYYPKQNIFVSGQIRSDLISDFKKMFSTKKSNIISFFSQPQPYMEDRYIETEFLIKSMLKFPKQRLIIKLHPREQDDIFSKLISKHNVKNVFIDNTTDTYELISKSDLALTCYSTVGIEILYFDKILITIDCKGKDLSDYTKNGIAYTAKNKNELVALLSKFYKNELKMKNEVKAFLKNTSIIDGKVCSRIYNEIIINQ